MNQSLFIVGMPRSGTKLLRDILSNHPLVSFPKIETECLPSWVEKYSEYDLSNFNEFQVFYKDVIKGVYFRHQLSAGESVISARDWFSSLNEMGNGVSAAFEALIKHDISFKKGMIWGDKSPSYINSIDTITLLYPHAKIILIVRDVRDYCLSIRHAWNKNIYRAAQRWSDSNYSALSSLSKFEGDYSVVRYEDLLLHPSDTISTLCEFIGVDYFDGILSLDKPSENIGGAKGSLKIESKNLSKWKNKMPEREIVGVERLSFKLLLKMKYEVINEFQKESRLSGLSMFIFKLLDGFNLVFSDRSSEKSILWKVRFHFRQMLDRT